MAAVAAGLLLGVIEAFSVSVVPLAFQDAIAIAILLVILFVRPHGLFGIERRGRAEGVLMGMRKTPGPPAACWRRSSSSSC